MKIIKFVVLLLLFFTLQCDAKSNPTAASKPTKKIRFEVKNKAGNSIFLGKPIFLVLLTNERNFEFVSFNEEMAEISDGASLGSTVPNGIKKLLVLIDEDHEDHTKYFKVDNIFVIDIPNNESTAYVSFYQKKGTLSPQKGILGKTSSGKSLKYNVKPDKISQNLINVWSNFEFFELYRPMGFIVKTPKKEAIERVNDAYEKQKKNLLKWYKSKNRNNPERMTKELGNIGKIKNELLKYLESK